MGKPGPAALHAAREKNNLPPSAQRGLAAGSDLREAAAFARELVRRHYENFPVVSLLLPRDLRQDFCNIYAFCRIADDLGDEMTDAGEADQALAALEQMTRECFAGRPRQVVFVALASSIRRHELPMQPFLDLIDAFRQDQRVRRYETFEQLLEYCRRSANPVGRLVLWICGYRDERRMGLADKVCTALQLTNFWQDVRRDLLERNRIYIPRQSMARFGVSEEQILQLRCDDRFRQLMRFEVDRTWAMFDEGEALLPLLDRRHRRHIALFAAGGREILLAIRRQGYDTVSKRPALSAWAKTSLLCRGMLAGILRRCSVGEQP